MGADSDKARRGSRCNSKHGGKRDINDSSGFSMAMIRILSPFLLSVQWIVRWMYPDTRPACWVRGHDKPVLEADPITWKAIARKANACQNSLARKANACRLF